MENNLKKIQEQVEIINKMLESENVDVKFQATDKDENSYAIKSDDTEQEITIPKIQDIIDAFCQNVQGIQKLIFANISDDGNVDTKEIQKSLDSILSSAASYQKSQSPDAEDASDENIALNNIDLSSFYYTIDKKTNRFIIENSQGIVFGKGKLNSKSESALKSTYDGIKKRYIQETAQCDANNTQELIKTIDNYGGMIKFENSILTSNGTSIVVKPYSESLHSNAPILKDVSVINKWILERGKVKSKSIHELNINEFNNKFHSKNLNYIADLFSKKTKCKCGICRIDESLVIIPVDIYNNIIQEQTYVSTHGQCDISISEQRKKIQKSQLISGNLSGYTICSFLSEWFNQIGDKESKDVALFLKKSQEIARNYPMHESKILSGAMINALDFADNMNTKSFQYMKNFISEFVINTKNTYLNESMDSETFETLSTCKSLLMKINEGKYKQTYGDNLSLLNGLRGKLSNLKGINKDNVQLAISAATMILQASAGVYGKSELSEKDMERINKLTKNTKSAKDIALLLFGMQNETLNRYETQTIEECIALCNIASLYEKSPRER